MKIPETSANVGAYYGNEDNGQWQPNGVIIDSGVGGGVVGSGDAGVHRPVYPVHIPRGHIPAGYVMAGAFYPPAAYPVQPQPDDFEDYMWMENEEEFDKQVMQQLEEEALMEQCIEAMLEDEQRERRQPATNGHGQPTTSSSNPLSLEETVSRSTLNPLAAEFVPTAGPAPPVVPLTPAAPEAIATAENRTETTTEPPAAPPAEPAEAAEPKADVTEPPTPEETPEVSAADIAPIDKRPKDNTKKDVKPKPEAKKQSKVDSKVKVKPQVVKSEPKVTQPRKKELVKAKSEVKVEEKVDEVAVGEAAKPQPVTPLEVPATPGFKPINYAAAARANKPKKPTTPPVEIPTATPTLKSDKDRKLEKRTEKPTLKTEKVAQRKNSAK